MYFSHEIEARNGDQYFVIRQREQQFKMGGETAGYSAVSKSAAWRVARSQSLPVIVEKFDDTTPLVIGVVFEPTHFERAAYRGYVSYGISMTDGRYAPLKFEQWVIDFRNDVLAGRDAFYQNDAPEHVKISINEYVKRLWQRMHVMDRHDADPDKQRKTSCNECRGGF